MKYLYRYEIEYKNWDDDTQIRLRTFPVRRETEKCYFIDRDIYGYRKRRVLKEALNTYAFDNKEDAKDHFIRRTIKRVEWLEFWKNECEKGLELIKKEN